MGFFNFIETFFFLSLGITFVLILLLVYHFKQRLTTLENKCDTVYEIITNLVQEVSNIRNIQIEQFTNNNNGYINHTIVPSFHNTEINGKIKVSDEGFDDSDQDDNNNDEDDENDGEDDDGEDDDGEDDDGEDDEDVDSNDEDEDESNIKPLIIVEEPFSNSQIKVINVNIGDEIISEIIEADINSENLDDDENNKLEPFELQEEEDPILVEKLEETSALENNELDITSKQSAKDVYVKMSVLELKALVITKGLTSDPSKKKKHELLKMLEAVEN
jgi:hypothetical protein